MKFLLTSGKNKKPKVNDSRKSIESEINYLQSCLDQVTQKIDALHAGHVRNLGISECLRRSTIDIRESLVRILSDTKSENNGKLPSFDPEDVYRQYREFCQGFWSGVFRRGLPSYEDIFKRVSRKLAKLENSEDLYEKERKLVQHLFLNSTHEIKKQIDKNKNSYTGELAGLGTLTAAQLSGFGVYTMASTLLGGITSMVGVTLPFAFYTTMSSAISVAIGPVGWGLLGAYAIGKWLSPDMKKVTEATLIITCTRVMIGSEQDKELDQLNKEKERLEARLNELEQTLRAKARQRITRKFKYICSILLSISAVIATAFTLYAYFHDASGVKPKTEDNALDSGLNRSQPIETSVDSKASSKDNLQTHDVKGDIMQHSITELEAAVELSQLLDDLPRLSAISPSSSWILQNNEIYTKVWVHNDDNSLKLSVKRNNDSSIYLSINRPISRNLLVDQIAENFSVASVEDGKFQLYNNLSKSEAILVMEQSDKDTLLHYIPKTVYDYYK